MTKEQIVLFYSVGIILLLFVFSILIYFKNKTIIKLRLKIEELDAIYFDEIKALENIIEKEKIVNNSQRNRHDSLEEKNENEQEVNKNEKN